MILLLCSSNIIHFLLCSLDTFFARLYHFNFAVDIGKFRRALQLPENNPHRPHPALLNAMYCLACHFADDVSLQRLEPTFHDRAQRHLDDSLAHVDRLFDFLAATTLLAQYHLIKGNLAKGSYLASCGSPRTPLCQMDL